VRHRELVSQPIRRIFDLPTSKSLPECWPCKEHQHASWPNGDRTKRNLIRRPSHKQVHPNVILCRPSRMCLITLARKKKREACFALHEVEKSLREVNTCPTDCKTDRHRLQHPRTPMHSAPYLPSPKTKRSQTKEETNSSVDVRCKGNP